MLSLCRVLSWLLVEEFVPEVVCRQGLMLNGSYPVWWGGSQLELEPLGLDKIDFMQGSMIWGEEDENTTSCLVWFGGRGSGG